MLTITECVDKAIYDSTASEELKDSDRLLDQAAREYILYGRPFSETFESFINYTYPEGLRY